MPFFSVIVPVYNRADLIGETIASVLAQDFSDFELLLIDDGSSDASVEVMRSWSQKDERIKIIELGENQGRCAARNKGLGMASAPWICYLDSDDIYYPVHLNNFRNWIDENPMVNAFASDQDINGTRKKYNNPRLNKDGILLTIEDFVSTNPFTVNQICHRSTLTVRWSEQRISISEDWLFMRQLSLQTSILKKSGSTCNLREHSDRSMRTVEPRSFVHYNLMAANEFLKNDLSHGVKKRIEAHILLLCVNVYLSNGDKKSARPLFKKSLGFVWSYGYALFYKALIKFLR